MQGSVRARRGTTRKADKDFIRRRANSSCKTICPLLRMQISIHTAPAVCILSMCDYGIRQINPTGNLSFCEWASTPKLTQLHTPHLHRHLCVILPRFQTQVRPRIYESAENTGRRQRTEHFDVEYVNETKSRRNDFFFFQPLVKLTARVCRLLENETMSQFIAKQKKKR